MDFFAYLKSEYGIALNPQQEQAARTVDGAALLLAVPGSGKTTVLIARLANMIQNHGISPHKILTITFSRRAAADMARRYAHYFPNSAQPRFATIHSFCYGVVNQISAQYRRPLPRVVEDISEIVRELYLRQENVRFVEREKLDEIVNAIGFCKNRLADEQQTAEMQIEDCDFAGLYQSYKAHMTETRQMDYDDMLVFTYDMFRKNPAFLAQYHGLYSHICVDEAQDTSLVQHRILEQLAEKSGNLFMVGDEDQSIYGFRGAFPEALLNFNKTYAGAVVLKMEQNYRSTKEVVYAANRLIKQNTARIEKKMFSEREVGAKVAVHMIKTPSAQYEKLLEILGSSDAFAAVLYRNNESAIPLVDALSRAGVPFSLKDTREAFFQTMHVRDMTAFLRLSIDPTDIESFSQIYAKTNAYFSRAVLDFVNRAHQQGESVFKTLSRCGAVDAGRLTNFKTQLERLKKQPPLNALNLLENIVSRSYFNSDTAVRRLMLLKSIAAKQETVEGLLRRLDDLRVIVRDASSFGKGNVTLSTIHSSKGLEYDRVVMVDLIEGQFPPKTAIDLLVQGERTSYEEEVRLCYVAATRARSELHLISFAEGNRSCRPSRFVRLLTVDSAPKQRAHPKDAALPPKRERQVKQIPGYCQVTDPAILVSGMSVLHDQFGEGRVLRVENGLLTWFDGVVTKRFSVGVCIQNQNLFVKNEDERIINLHD